MITVRQPEDIYQTSGAIEKGTFEARWHFSFESYQDPTFENYGTMLAFNDYTFSAGALWPLHPHRDVEVVTYCVEGEFQHADEYGPNGVLRKGGVQHATVGRGMWYSEINNLPNQPLRFLQIWFLPVARDLIPALDQKQIPRVDRTNHFLPLVSIHHENALPIFADAEVHACFLESKAFAACIPKPKRGTYVYLIEGGPVMLNGYMLAPMAAAMIKGERVIGIVAETDAELLLVDVLLS